MQVGDPFGRKLSLWKRTPGAVRDAAVRVKDTLELSWAAAQSIFEEKATPELALAIYDRFVRVVRATVDALTATGVRVHCLALGGVDLTSAAGKMTMQVLNAVAEFERDLLVERTNSGIARAKAEGKHIGPSIRFP